MQQITITIKVEIPDGITPSITTNTMGTNDPVLPDNEPLNPEIEGTEVAEQMISANAPASMARLQRLFIDRCEEFAVIVKTAKPPSTRTYLSLVPTRAYGGPARVGALETRSGRVYAACNLDHVNDVPGSEPAEGKWVTIYLQAEVDVDRAIELIRFAMGERGWRA